MDYIKNFFDVELAVKADLEKLTATRITAEQLERQEESRAAARAATLAALAEETAAIRETRKAECRPALERADELSLAGIFFKQMQDAVRDAFFNVRNLMDNETQQYGYVSKNVLSLTLSLEALRAAMASGRPFHHELQSFKESVGDVDNELAVWADVLQHFAFKGLPQKPDAHAAAVRLAHAVREVEVYRVADYDQPRSFLDFLRFSANRFMPAFRPEVYADYANAILDSTRAGDYDLAVHSADEAARVFGMERLNKHPLDPSRWAVEDRGRINLARVPPAAAYYHFRECISGIVVARQFHEYCRASLTMQQYRVAEPFLH